MVNSLIVLDVCCGPRGFWFSKKDGRVLFSDKRSEIIKMSYPSGNYTERIEPDIVANFTALPYKDNTFAVVVFDPPHIKRSGPYGRITKRYGFLSGEWREMLRLGFSECFRVLRPEGVLIFKWCEVQFSIREILALSPHTPLFGHQSGKRLDTHWVSFLKPNKRVHQTSQ